MIRKFMVNGRHTFLSAKRYESDEDTYVLELLMPVEVFWKAEGVVKHCDYLLANSEDRVAINDEYRKLYKIVLPYAVHEKDRVWLLDRVQGKGS